MDPQQRRLYLVLATMLALLIVIGIILVWQGTAVKRKYNGHDQTVCVLGGGQYNWNGDTWDCEGGI